MMSNPHVKEDWFLHYLEEKTYVNDNWFDTGIWVEVGGLGLIICTISISSGWNCNVGFRVVDENNIPLQPYRTTNNNRHPTHFTFEPYPFSGEDLTPVTFHMIANCKYAKLQIRPSDATSNNTGRVRINAAPTDGTSTDAIWNHKPISTMSVIPLAPNYQPGANTVFTYSQSRMPRMPDENDKKSSSKKSNIN